MKKPQAPRHLGQKAAKLWRDILGDYDISDSAGKKILQVALEALDRAETARRRIDRDGMMIQDRFGAYKVHPLLKIEHMSRASFLAGIRQLNLDVQILES